MTTNDVLFATMCLTALYARSAMAAVFCAAYAVHSFYAPAMEQWLRYVILILIDSAVAFIACAVGPISIFIRRKLPRLEWLSELTRQPSRGTVLTCVFSGIFLIINAAGFVLWFLYLPPATYDAACSAVYIAMMVAFITKGSNGSRRMALRRMGHSSSGSPVRKGMGVHHKDGDKA
jgi:hypothetical protein